MNTEQPKSTQSQPAGELAALMPALQDIARTGAALVNQMYFERRSEQRWRNFKRLTALAIMVSIGLFQFVIAGGPSWFPAEPAQPSVAIIDIAGEISAKGKVSADTIVPLIDRACRNSNVKALLLDINSPGGAPAEAERISRALDICREDGNKKKVIAVVENLAASAAYLIAVNTDEIVSSRYALVGSIGAIMTSYDAKDALGKLGVEGRIYASGPLKAMGAPTQHDTPAQARAAQSLVDGAARLFRAEVEARRGNKLKDDPDLYSGRVWTADQAQALGLVDRLDVIDHILATDFKGLSVQHVQPHRPLTETLGLASFSQDVASQILAAISTPQIH